MRTLAIAFILLFTCVPCFGHGNGLPDQWQHSSPEGGCSNAFYIDRDCDGYGVGQGYVAGPDADDEDPAVNTSATVIAKYGTIQNFLSVRKGYNPTSFKVIDVNNGVDPGAAATITLQNAGYKGARLTSTITNGGTGYIAQNAVPTTGGTGTGLAVNVRVTAGVITSASVSPDYAGSGYTAGDVVTVVQAGGSGGQIRIDSVSTGYTTAHNLPTTLSSGAGENLTVNITALDGYITSATIANPGRGYTVGSVVTVTQTGGNRGRFTIASNIPNGGIASPDLATALARPFKTYKTMIGDFVVIRGGTYDSATYGNYMFQGDGREATPFTFICYPGETVYMNPLSVSFNLTTSSKGYITIDGMGGGFVHKNTANGSSAFFGAKNVKGITIRECEESDNSGSYRGGWINLDTVLLERCIFARSANHEVYFTANPVGSAYYPGKNITIRGCLFYHNPDNADYGGYGCLAFNGGFDGVLVEGCTFHGMYAVVVTLEAGAKNVTIRNNVVFNHGRAFIQLYYTMTSYWQFPLPYENILVEHNTVWHGNKTLGGGNFDSPSIIAFNMPREWPSIWVWTPNTYFPPATSNSHKITRSDGSKFPCVYHHFDKGGTTGATEPIWPTTTGASVVDGTNTWYAWCEPVVRSVEIRNNIFVTYMTGGTGIFWFANIGYGYWGDPTVALPNIHHNLFYSAVDSTKVMWRTDGGTGISTYYNFDQFQAYTGNSANFHDNLYGDPLFVNASVNDYANPGAFDLHVKEESPALAIGAGAFGGAPPPIDTTPPLSPGEFRVN